MATRKKWANKATKVLKGKIVDKVIYTGDRMMEEMGWSSSAPVILFTDGTYIMASSDPEGNGPGTLFTPIDDISILGPI
jgi:hypothetical protein